jgi:hypothetical protein
VTVTPEALAVRLAPFVDKQEIGSPFDREHNGFRFPRSSSPRNLDPPLIAGPGDDEPWKRVEVDLTRRLGGAPALNCS